MTEERYEVRLAGFRRGEDERPRVSDITLTDVDKADRTAPMSDDQTLWRYLSLSKFISLLSSWSLWFSRLDKLGDPFEGAATQGELNRREAHPEKDVLDRIGKAGRHMWFVNCWHMGQTESDAMWQLYSSLEEGIAVCTCAGRLRAALRNSRRQYVDPAKEKEILLPGYFFGSVVYAEHTHTQVEGNQYHTKYFLKRPAFQHESEFRVVAPHPSLASDAGLEIDEDSAHAGIYVPVDLQELITEIVISPGSEAWYRHAVGDLGKRYGLQSPIRSSALGEAPRY